jgi:hypothetical protein
MNEHSVKRFLRFVQLIEMLAPGDTNETEWGKYHDEIVTHIEWTAYSHHYMARLRF